MLNKYGDSTEPCITPKFTSKQTDQISFHLTQEKMGNNFEEYRSALATIVHDVGELWPKVAGQSLQVHGNPTHTPIDTSTATVNRESTAGTQSADATVLFDGSAPTNDWATRMSTAESLRSSVFRRRSSRAR